MAEFLLSLKIFWPVYFQHISDICQEQVVIFVIKGIYFTRSCGMFEVWHIFLTLAFPQACCDRWFTFTSQLGILTKGNAWLCAKNIVKTIILCIKICLIPINKKIILVLLYILPYTCLLEAYLYLDLLVRNITKCSIISLNNIPTLIGISKHFVDILTK